MEVKFEAAQATGIYNAKHQRGAGKTQVERHKEKEILA